MRGALFIGIVAIAALCSGACASEQLKSGRCFPALALEVVPEDAWKVVTHLEQPKQLRQWDCLESGDLVGLAEHASSGSLHILYLDGRVFSKECPSRSQCVDAYKVEAMQASPPSRGGFWDGIE